MAVDRCSDATRDASIVMRTLWLHCFSRVEWWSSGSGLIVPGGGSEVTRPSSDEVTAGLNRCVRCCVVGPVLTQTHTDEHTRTPEERTFNTTCIFQIICLSAASALTITVVSQCAHIVSPNACRTLTTHIALTSLASLSLRLRRRGARPRGGPERLVPRLVAALPRRDLAALPGRDAALARRDAPRGPAAGVRLAETLREARGEEGHEGAGRHDHGESDRHQGELVVVPLGGADDRGNWRRPGSRRSARQWAQRPVISLIDLDWDDPSVIQVLQYRVVTQPESS